MKRISPQFINSLILLFLTSLGSNIFAQDDAAVRYNINEKILRAYDSLNMDKYQSAETLFFQVAAREDINKYPEFRCKAFLGHAVAEYFNKGKTLTEEESLNILSYIPADNSEFECAAAPAYYAVAGYAKRRNEFEKSIAYLDTTISLIQNSTKPDTSLLGRAFGLKGQCLYRIGNMTEAVTQYLSAKNFVENYSKLNPDHLIKYTQAVGTIYARMQDFDQALPYFKTALDLKRFYGLPQSRNDIIYHNNLGNIYFDRKQFHQASEMFDEAIRIATQLFGPDYELLGNVYLNQGNIFVQVADFTKAREYYLKALSFKNLSEENLRSLYNNIGYTYFRLQEYDQAIRYFEKGLENNSNSSTAIRSLCNLAQSYHGLYMKQPAEETFEKALALANTRNDEINLEYAYALQDYGQFLIETGRPARAIESLDEAISILMKQDVDKRDNVAIIHSILANYYYTIKDYPAALNHIQDALIALEPGFNDADFHINPNIETSESPYELLGILALKAQVLFETGRAEKNKERLILAATTFKDASAVLDMLKTSYSYDDSKLFLSGQSNQIYHHAIEVNYELFAITGDTLYLNYAYNFTEKSKYSTLLEAYRETVIRNQSISPKDLDNLLSLESQLEKAIRALYEASDADKADQSKIDLLNTQIFNLNRKKDSLEAHLNKLNPGFQDVTKQLEVISPSEIQQQLGPDHFLIEFSLHDSTVFAFAISSGSLSIEKIEINTSSIDTLRSALDASELANYSRKDYETFINSSYYLYQKLISPFEACIIDKSLIIIPDSKLGYIPFEALITKMPDSEKMDFRSPDYLLKHNEISYSYSATLLFEDRNDYNGNSKGKLLAFAPEYDYKGLTYGGDTLLSQLAPIPGVKDEIYSIQKYFSGSTLEGKEATEDAFKKYAPEYDILHLAMHTLIDPKNPTYSKLVFSAPDTTNSTDDGVLYTSELFSMSLQSKMAVLSACQTGDGAIKEGEGILSLARGFFYAGVPSVVMTLWSVDDARSALIMESFYKYLKKGYSKDQALRQAKLDLLETGDPLTAHPRFWAGYVSIGNQNPVTRNNHWMFILAGIILISLAGFITARNIQSRRRK